MARIEKTVFISYRRSDVYTALAVYENLKNQGYDVFFDYRSISSGDFEQIITSNIRARAHFLLILTPTALDRCNQPGDWLRREIETAIDEKRNIVPLFFKGFRFGVPSNSGKSKLLRFGRSSASDTLTGKLRDLSRYNGLNVHEDYFDEAMHRLRTEYLNKPLDTVLHPVSTEVRKVVREEQIAADKALEQIEDVRELAKQVDEKPDKPKDEPALEPVEKAPFAKNTTIQDEPRSDRSVSPKFPTDRDREEKKIEKPARESVFPDRAAKLPQSEGSMGSSPRTLPDLKSIASRLNLRLLWLVAGVILVVVLVLLVPRSNIFAPKLGSTMISEKDGMTMVYVPAGEFTMGNDNDSDDEKPVHTVTLDAFWIDQTEVTNIMYAKCVQDGACDAPSSTKSYTRDSYYGNAEFDNYPVIYVSWEDAAAYCSWADRRLPTEAEWEKAARWKPSPAGGGQGEGESLTYPWGNDFDGTKVNFCDTNCSFDWADKNSDDGYADTAPAGSYPSGASPYGALDMAGNVWELVGSLYQPYPYDSGDGRENLNSTDALALRGGSWNYIDYEVRSARRGWIGPTNSDYHVGFRCVFSENEPVESTPLVQVTTDTLSSTQTSQPTQTGTPSPTQTSIPATPTLGIGSTMTGQDGMTLLYVPAGEFKMGSSYNEVNLDAFWIDRTEVTNEMYGTCVQAGDCKPPNNVNRFNNVTYKDFPVVFVTWSDAQEYCAWAERRLPSDAEWEKAARGTDGRPYPWGNKEPNDGLVNYGYGGNTTKVGSYPAGASPYKALDMSGNVWEWIADQRTFNGSGTVRGGSYLNQFNNVIYVIAAYESSPMDTSSSSSSVGFRCAMDATP